MATSTKKYPILSIPPINAIIDDLLPHYDPVYVEFYNKYNAGRLATHQIPIEDYRANPLKYTISWGRQLVDPTGLNIVEQKCPVKDGEIKIRVYEPEASKKSEKPRPVFIHYHGGGWVFGNLETSPDFCKRIAIELDTVVFDVDYRLSPEYPYPIPVDDCWAALNWVRDHKATEFNIDLNRVAVGGASAGGHLAAVIAHMCRDSGTPLAFQVLTVPVCDLHAFTPEGKLRDDCPYESYRTNEFAVPLPLERMSYFHKAFLGNPRPKELDNDWKVSPMLAPNFKGLAPALVSTAEMDPLRDEGELYGAKMNAAGSKAEIIRYKGAPHVFMTLDEILITAQEYNRDVLRALGAAFGVTPKTK